MYLYTINGKTIHLLAACVSIAFTTVSSAATTSSFIFSVVNYDYKSDAGFAISKAAIASIIVLQLM